MKFVYFDMGGVLFSKGTKNTFNYLRKKRISESLIKYTLISNDSWNMRRGKISSEEFWEKVKEKDIKNASIIRDTWLNSYKINPKMYKYSLDLKEKGFNILGKITAALFAVFCIGGSFGGGNAAQSNQATIVCFSLE